MSSIDIIAIKDEIKRYKARSIELEKENRRISAELSDVGARNAALKTEFGILACMEEIRFHDNVLDAAEAGEIVFDKKFREANMKLEIQILNDEIRQVIPKLEQEAAGNEAAVKRLARQQAEVGDELGMFPSQFLVSSDETQRKIDVLKKRKAEIEGASSDRCRAVSIAVDVACIPNRPCCKRGQERPGRAAGIAVQQRQAASSGLLDALLSVHKL